MLQIALDLTTRCVAGGFYELPSSIATYDRLIDRHV